VSYKKEYGEASRFVMENSSGDGDDDIGKSSEKGGLLNVLDGVVDTPCRILLMTTNHPEMLLLDLGGLTRKCFWDICNALIW